MRLGGRSNTSLGQGNASSQDYQTDLVGASLRAARHILGSEVLDMQEVMAAARAFSLLGASSSIRRSNSICGVREGRDTVCSPSLGQHLSARQSILHEYCWTRMS